MSTQTTSNPKVYRFSGNPENWITALRLKAWALNPKNRNVWGKLNPNDIVLFHATRRSDYVKQSKSAIIGYGRIGKECYRKDSFWWIQELQAKTNFWPFVVPFKEMHIFSHTKEIDLKTPLKEKKTEMVIAEIESLLKQAVPLSEAIAAVKAMDEEASRFPVLGSASGVHPLYQAYFLHLKK